MLPYLNAKRQAARRTSRSYWRFGDQMAIRQGDWKLVRVRSYGRRHEGKAATDAKLYNLADDIGESKDLIKSEPEKAKALQAAWDEWNESNVSTLRGRWR